MLTVHIRMHGPLQRFLPEHTGSTDLALPPNTRAAGLLEILGAREDVWLIVVNDEAVSPDHVLRHGDRIDLFPPMEGG